MKANNQNITGILHRKHSAKHYQLRRYLPDSTFQNLIDQFWLVDWDLPTDTTHTQVNLPDINFHLVVERDRLNIMGPVSKRYRYTMQAKGWVYGVKFELAALTSRLQKAPSHYVDKQLRIEDVFGVDGSDLFDSLKQSNTDHDRLEIFQSWLKPFSVSPTPSMLKAKHLVEVIKNQSHITKVESLSSETGFSNRTIQRCFQQHLGVSPKWLIRKYRLHRALELLEQDQSDISELVVWLDYTDQSHLIRDFKEILGITPHRYLQTKATLKKSSSKKV